MAGDPDAIAGGGAAFRPYCTPCHGIRGEGGRGPDLTHGVYSAGDKDSDLFNVIAHGVPGTDMAGFASELSQQDIWRIVAFIRSLARHDVPAMPGNRAAGEKLFWGKGGCGACHAVNGKGGRLGPPLSRIGRERSLAFLRESVLTPNSDVKPQYATVTAVKRDGTKMVGIGSLDNFTVQITDAAGNDYSFERSDLASSTRELKSLMPDDYGRKLTAAEIDDLLAYLVSLRGAEAAR
ncbi:MAG: c-type cytochrome [Acidobacteriia bacterium]|nr:c-type cytochrome [Terriglobia bacterium]